MKYKVSLLPEYNRKRLIGKKKLERIKVYSLVILLVLALFLAVVMFTKFFAENKLNEVKKLDSECAQEVAELEQFREINATLQEKVKLIESIQVNEPQLVNFLAKLSNLKSPGISIENIECTDWKIARNCVIMGTCDNREQYLAFEEALGKIEDVTAVACVTYSPNVGAPSQFTINVTCSGGAAPIVTTTEAVTNAEGETEKAEDSEGDEKEETTAAAE